MFSNIKGDVLGGLTAGIVALPLALAFGVSSGLGPSAGLYGAIFLSFFAALFGGTATQISGPTAPMTAVSMVVIATIIGVHNGSVEKALPYILAVFLLSGIFQIGLGFLGLGKYIKYIPYPVVSGFMTAIGVIIIDMEKVPYIDQSGLFALEDVILDLDKKDIKIIMTGIQSQPMQLMKTIGILGELIPEERVFKSLADSKSFLIDQVK